MIEDIYEELRRLGAVHNMSQFSEAWLGKERSYMRCLRSKKRSASKEALANCATRLLLHSRALSKSTMPPHVERGAKLRQLADACLIELLDGQWQKGADCTVFERL